MTGLSFFLSNVILLHVLWGGTSFSIVGPTGRLRRGCVVDKKDSHGCPRNTSLSSSSSSSSRLEGNQRSPSAQELALMDEMIDKLLDAKPYELPSAVKRAFQVIRSPKFFLRIAQRSDEANDESVRQRFEILAANLLTTVEAVVETTSEQLADRAQAVENVVKAAAEPDSGEFLVPLTPERVLAMQTAVSNLPESSLDEAFLTTLDTWIVKSHQDGMDGMVGILQKVLQMYAGLSISRALKKQLGEQGQALEQEGQLEQLLKADASDWNAQLRSKPKNDIANVKRVLQRTMETVVLSLETGSLAQQVQAEYLKELLNRVETAEKEANK